MTVKQLIAKLQNLPEDSPVFVGSCIHIAKLEPILDIEIMAGSMPVLKTTRYHHDRCNCIKDIATDDTD